MCRVVTGQMRQEFGVSADEHASAAAQDDVAAARAALRALQGESDRGAQGEHVRRRQNRHGAPPQPARAHQPQPQVRQEQRARPDALENSLPH